MITNLSKDSARSAEFGQTEKGDAQIAIFLLDSNFGFSKRLTCPFQFFAFVGAIVSILYKQSCSFSVMEIQVYVHDKITLIFIFSPDLHQVKGLSLFQTNLIIVLCLSRPVKRVLH